MSEFSLSLTRLALQHVPKAQHCILRWVCMNHVLAVQISHRNILIDTVVLKPVKCYGICDPMTMMTL